MGNKHQVILLFTSLASLSLQGCAPTVKLEGNEKPITINLNVKINHNIQLQIDKDVNALIEKNSDLF